eukprot:gene6853-30829_t
MVGVSFFAPIDLLGTAAHAYYQRRAPDSECYNVDRNKFLPEEWTFSGHDVGSSSTSPNEALMCYLLLHDIGARDSPLNTLLYDSWRSRLVYKALCGYDTETCAISNAGGVWAGMRPLLEAVLPSYIHVSDDTDDEDGDKDGIDGTSSERVL